MPTHLQSSIQSALQAIPGSDFRAGHLELLATLGYKSDKTITIAGARPKAFLEMLEANSSGAKFDPGKALFNDWTQADLLFQLTDDELSREASLFKDTSVQPGLLQSYLFFAIELNGQSAVNGTYARGKLTAIARQINRAFPMPVMVLIQHPEQGREVLSIAVINRRANKREQHKDVLGKVTIIRDISLADPHRGHLDILESFAVPNLRHPQKLPINSFETLHTAWEEIFNIELLNKRFYKELANWYFWALPQVDFPADLEPDAEKRRATGLIRLLTRLIFCWFIKEKGLIPEKLFHRADLADILKDFDPESRDSSQYYQAILQNLFFATLNQRMGKDSKGEPFRHFVPDEGFQKNRKNHDLNNYYRYEALFAGSQEDALAHFADIPFLNGGLFECLDRRIEEDKKTYYLDGFSRNAKKRPSVPNHLFFADEIKGVDLSDVYHDNRRKTESVSGLIRILNRYKFTIVENTPIDQEIALDPELLGKVFENLLASYNEETKTTARKQTGSFYTPRPIVDYMVDESLKAYLEKKVAETILSRSTSKKSEAELTLLPYNPNAPTHKTRANLPHWTQEGTTYWVTFRLADSLPREKLTAWKSERDAWLLSHPEPWDEAEWKDYDERFGKRLEAWLDAGSGQCHLRRPEIRAIVEKCLLHFDGIRYDLGPWVIMPNHVHLIIRPKGGQTLSKILQGIKGVSAKECNALLGQTGQPFWQEESFDHIVRSQAQFDRFVRYIADNPIKAKLREGDYQSSSDNPVADPSEQSETGLPESSSDNPVADLSMSETGLPESGSDNPVADLSMSETGLSRLRSRLDHLFTYTEKPHQFSDTEVAVLIRAIDRCKILDPACGSGAFPMGILHKLVFILGKLDPGNERWKQTQLDKLDSAPMREELERTFEDNDDDYGRKLYLIENCLYGVDIQPIAIQISKLRFFISLICDQKTNRDKAKNHGVRPLPNLETKFVAADTLIGLPEMDQSLLIDPRVDQIEKEIASLYHRHFGIQRRDQKLALQRKIKDLRKELGSILAESLMAPAKAQHVANWDPFDPQASSDFFDPFWMFGIFAGQKTRKDAGTLNGNLSGIVDDELTATTTESDGFDIVIGNPPYVQIQKFPKAQKDRWVAQDFQTYAATADIYCLFYERGAQLLKDGGSLVYITSNKWMRAGYGEKLRKYLSSQVDTESVLDFGMAQNFGAATTYTCITRFYRQPPDDRIRSCYVTDDRAAMADPAEYFEANRVVQPNLSAEPWVVLTKERQAIKSLVEAQGIPLKKWDVDINYGIKTGFNDAFYITSEQREALIAEDPKCEELIVPLLRGRYVSRYATSWDGTWMIATFPSLKFDFQNLPRPIQKHLSAYRERLEPKPKGWAGSKWNGRKPGAYKWFETQDSIGYHNEFAKPKIILQEIAVTLPFIYDTSGMFMDTTCFMLNSDTEDLEYLTAFLNTSLFRCCFRANFPEYSGNACRVKKIFVERIPVKKPGPTEAELFEKLVPLIQLAKSSSDNPVADLRQNSDNPVADLRQNSDKIVGATMPAYNLLEALIDACVMECYFREHMAERDLLFQDAVAAQLQDYDPDADHASQTSYLESCHTRLQATDLPQKLQAIPEKSPDLLGIILKEGKV